jgi:hypothetical protein
MGLALDAEVAASARADQGHHHRVAGFDQGNLGTDLRDHAGGLVPVYGRQHSAPVPIYVVNVAVANGASSQFYFYFPGLRRVNIYLLND